MEAFYRDDSSQSGRKAACITCTGDRARRKRLMLKASGVVEVPAVGANGALGQDLPSRMPKNLLFGRPEYCPRCGGHLIYEPLYARCKYGCSRLWVIANGDTKAQRRYEQVSGMNQAREA